MADIPTPPKLPPAPAPLPGTAPAEGDTLPAEQIVATLTFWQLPWVQNLLPLLTSFLVHAVLITLALIIGRAVVVISKTVTQEQITIPDTTLAENGPVGGVPNPGLGGDPNRAAAQDSYKDVPPDGLNNKPNTQLTQSLVQSSDGSADAASVFASGPKLTTGTGKGKTGGGEASGGVAGFGVPGGGGGSGPKSAFMGVGGNARLICYVCDASGSMMNKRASLVRKIQESIDTLRPTQAFSIIFFADEKPQSLNQSLVLANGDNKKKAYDFLSNVQMRGSTDPIPGLELAFKQKPQLVYLLTDGDFPDNEAVVKKITALNADKKVKINTIAFVSKGDTEQAFIEVLTRIARENGGVFARKAEEELN